MDIGIRIKDAFLSLKNSILALFRDQDTTPLRYSSGFYGPTRTDPNCGELRPELQRIAEKGKALIASHEYNVTEAAYEVGYLSPSHFTKAFRKEFGITPKALRKAGEKQLFFMGQDGD